MNNLQIIGSKQDLQKFVEAVINTLNLNQQDTPINPGKLISQQEMALKLGITVATLIARRNKNEIPFYKIGVKYLYDPKMVLEAIQRGKNNL